MVTFEEALNLVLNNKVSLHTKNIKLPESLGYVLAEDVVSDIDMPPFDKSAMDGYAIKIADIDKELTIIETIAAGQTPRKTVNTGEAAKIMTGAPIPKGADWVIQVEQSEQTGANKVKFTGQSKSNIIPKAEDASVGDTLLKKGQLIDARHIAVMASVGYHQPLVYCKPKVAVLSTGSEIVEPHIKPKASQIRNSNGLQIYTQVLQCNAEAIYYGIVKDDFNETKLAINKALNECGIVLLTGGVSMGEFDFVPKIMQELGVHIHFQKMAVQPGKPTTFGTLNNKFIFGLPGNPVSSFIQFEILVKPLINKCLGKNTKAPIIKLPLGKDFKRKKSERLAFLPVTISENSEIFTFEYHGSAHINALPSADALMEIPIGVAELNKGELVNVRLF